MADGGLSASSKVTSVKCGLVSRLLKPDEDLSRITQLVKYISRVARNGSCMVNLFLTHHLESNKGFLPEWIDISSQQFFYAAFVSSSGVHNSADKDDQFFREMQAFRALYLDEVFSKLETERPKGCTQLINESCKQYHENFQNHHEVPLFSRIWTFMKHRLPEGLVDGLTPAVRRRLRRFVWDSDTVYPVDESLQPHLKWIQEMRERYAVIKQHLAEKEYKLYWRRLVEFTYWLGVNTDLHYRPSAAERRRRSREVDDGDDASGKCNRAHHSIAPICEIKLRSIALTPTTLQQAFGHSDWHKIFKEGTFRLRSPANWCFGGRILTDGVSMSVQFHRGATKRGSKYRSKGDRANAKKTRAKKQKKKVESEDSLSDVAPDRIIAIDPGSCNIYFAVEQMGDGEFKSWKYTVRQYYRDAYMWKSMKVMSRLRDSCAPAMEALQRCVKKTVIFAEQLRYWRTYAESAHVLFSVLACKLRSKMAMNVYIHRQKALDRFLKKLKDGCTEDPVIAYGDAGFSATIRGTLPSPKSLARRRCELMYKKTIGIDEYKTSQKCPHCEGDFITPKEPRVCRDGVTRNVEIRSVRWCNHPQCLSRAAEHSLQHVRDKFQSHGVYEVSRDKAAAMNIHACAVGKFWDPPYRPAYLQRPPDDPDLGGGVLGNT